MPLINTLDAPGEFDAAPKLRPGEPYFLLIGRDRLAPPLVIEWAKQSRMRAMRMGPWSDLPELPDAERDEELEKATEAERIGWSMKAYKEGRPKHEQQPRERVTYTGHQLPEETQRRDREQRARSRTVEALNGAAGELNGAAQEFRDLGLTDEADALDAKVLNLRHMVELIRPPRPVLGQ